MPDPALPNPPALDVVLFGEALLLLIADRPGALEDAQSFTKRTAGAETNVAIGLARLGFKVGWASRLGSDSMARHLLATMQHEGVDCSRVRVDAAQRTGFMFKGRLADPGDASGPPIEYHRAGSAASRMDTADIDAPWLRSARHLHATGVFAALAPGCLEASHASIATMRAAGRSVSFDPNLRPALWPSVSVMRAAVNQLAVQSDWLLPGLDEGRLLTGEVTPEAIARHYRLRGVALVVVKLGADGAYFDGPSGCGRVAASAVARMVDTVGAGDAFAVGVISGLLEGLEVPAAVARGAWIGARAVQVLGDTEGLPTRRELLAAAL